MTTCLTLMLSNISDTGVLSCVKALFCVKTGRVSIYKSVQQSTE